MDSQLLSGIIIGIGTGLISSTAVAIYFEWRAKQAENRAQEDQRRYFQAIFRAVQVATIDADGDYIIGEIVTDPDTGRPTGGIQHLGKGSVSVVVDASQKATAITNADKQPG